MKILICGATGLIGKTLTLELLKLGHSINILTTQEVNTVDFDFPANIFYWNPSKNIIDVSALKDIDLVINLSGYSIDKKRWDKKVKSQILNSRVLSTRLLVKSLNQINPNIRLINASAIGIYQEGFIKDVCEKWEHEVISFYKNYYILRIGIVLAKEGGALNKMLPAFKFGLGAYLGSGKQVMNIVHINDLVNQIIHIASHNPQQKIFNGVSHSLTNKEFSHLINKTLKKPLLFKAPRSIIKIILGQMSQVVLNSSSVKKETESKFKTVTEVLEDLLQEDLKGQRRLFRTQFIPKNLEETFTFFCDEKNLEMITPKELNFNVLGKNTAKIQSGTLIDYKLKIHGIGVKWTTEILDFEMNKKFTDTQLKGPYKKWYHVHEFYPVCGGTLMLDTVDYILPFGKLGDLLGIYFVKKDLKKIFNYRKEVINNYFKGE
ncbi:MAG: NAD-dependent epimerase/dehydratase family protein [Bacteriovoracaceae bacterium]|jgi:uncharacterized protein (TIGR01777 family)|nr:NAD-dependent epimerase/dehydratase family protein [Bacteriovoracaceae bacterium]